MLRIEKRHADDMIEHALAETPIECCGILAGVDHTVQRVYRITNTARSTDRYLMDPQEQLSAMLDSERNEWDLLCFYHSHTHSPAFPSQTDINSALESGWLDVFYFVVSLQNEGAPEIRNFHIDESGVVTEEEYELF